VRALLLASIPVVLLLAILLAKHHGASSAAIGAMFALAGAGDLLGAVCVGSAAAA
jgi:hypothetical protein